jgi:hypothetical protein
MGDYLDTPRPTLGTNLNSTLDRRFAAAYQTVRCRVASSAARLSHANGHRRRVKVKIIAYDRFKPGVSMDKIKPYIQEEVANVWRLWKAGVVRENYARADANGVVIVFECRDLAEAKGYVEDFPLSKAGLLEWNYISLEAAPMPLEFIFDPHVDVGEPFDRTKPRTQRD